jgi:cytochrome d ubiquinol oxidase subunit I
VSALTAILAEPAVPANLLPAREQMAFTLGFHIIIVPFGVAFTFLMLVANYRGIRRGDENALLLARRWSQVSAVLFAVGAVTGTVLSFELGLLWPRLMGTYGAAFGIPFGVEGLFFFLEAIFVAIYIYGWKRMRPWPHFFSGIPVVLAGIGGTLSVVAANSRMNRPGGFTVADGKLVEVRPLEVFFNGAFGYEALHMLCAAYMVAGFFTAGVYAVGMLRGRRDRYHRLGLLIPLTVAAIITPIQFLVGDVAAREVFNHEPAKFAAIEALSTTGSHVPEVLGGIYYDGRLQYGIEIPDGASLLSDFRPGTEIRGLDAVPPELRLPDRLVSLVHLSFDVMVGIGSALLLLSLWYAFVWWRKRDLPRTDWFYRAVAVSGVLAIIALEAGWIVTEVGRQPWTVVGHLLTRDAVTTSGNLWPFFGATLLLYAIVGTAAVLVLRLMTRQWRTANLSDDLVAVPYGPGTSE